MKTDRQLRSNLKNSMGNATVIMVAQRVSSILNADRILVVAHGKIVGNGAHSELLQSLRGDIDRKMHRTGLNYYDTRTNGEILSVITNYVDTVNGAVSRNLTQIVTQVITAIGVLLMMLRISPRLTLIAVVVDRGRDSRGGKGRLRRRIHPHAARFL